MLEKVKLALRIKTDAFDDEITDLIAAALADLALAGIVQDSEEDKLIIRAVITYCKANFGNSENYDRLKNAYDEQKAQMKSATGYTEWGDVDGSL